MFKNYWKILFYFSLIFCLINWISCWPNFHLYKKDNINKFEIINAKNISTSNFEFSKTTKILIHGFLDDGFNFRILKIKDEILKTNDVNLIVIDWGEGAKGPNYIAAADNTRIVGQKTGEFIKLAGINANQTHCIGHSLGAHCCGFTGKQIKLDRITGLDPAGPLFSGKSNKDRLDKSDAYLVDNIHTDWALGIQESIGHKDFYPNGGKSQPGCGIRLLSKEQILKNYIFFKSLAKSDFIACSHVKVTYYFAESVNSNCSFTSTPCTAYDHYKDGKCRCDPKSNCSPMGFRANENLQEGNFYLETNKDEPYCKG